MASFEYWDPEEKQWTLDEKLTMARSLYNGERWLFNGPQRPKWLQTHLEPLVQLSLFPVNDG